MTTITTKRCTACGSSKESTEFHLNAQARDGRHAWCKECKNARARVAISQWTPAQRELHRRRVLRFRYGVEMDLIQDLYERQEGCCAICSRPGQLPTTNEYSRTRSGVLFVDHDHANGEVRGLLCNTCNSALGKFGDSVETLVRAAAYLLERGGQ